MLLPLQRLAQTLVRPCSQDEDRARQESILHTLLLGMMALSLTGFLINLAKGLLEMHVPVSAGLILAALLLFSAFYALSKSGFSRIATYLFLGLFFLLVSSMSFRWGVDLPTGLMAYALLVVMSGILLSSRLAFVTTALVAVAILGIMFLERAGLVQVDHYWRQEPWELPDSLFTLVMFTLIATVCWLYNREIKKSLGRARASEAELKEERDQLEVKVEQRTQQLKEAQADKMAHLYRFAEFGRLSSGLFHDLINPLNAVSLNVERLQKSRQGERDGTFGETSGYVESAVRAAKNLEKLVVSVRKQLAKQEDDSVFSLRDEIAHVMDVLQYKARDAQVDVSFLCDVDAQIFGNAGKFNQAILNLVSNGIDAHPGADADSQDKPREVVVTVQKNGQVTTVQVRDTGAGIPEAHLSKIFEPFFSTKAEGHGIGLWMTHRIIERDFRGTILVESSPGQGTVFTLALPSHEPSPA